MNILLAEDDRNFGPILKQELEDDGFGVDLVNNGVDALLSFLSKPYGFVLLDIRMPKLDGIDCLRIIKKIDPRVPAITFSGNAGLDEMKQCIECGASKFFLKPFEVGQLKRDIRRICSGEACLKDSPLLAPSYARTED